MSNKNINQPETIHKNQNKQPYKSLCASYFGSIYHNPLNLSYTTTVYNGKEQKPLIYLSATGWSTRDMRECLREGIDYEVTFKGDLVNPGTVLIHLKGIGQCFGEKVASYKIEPTEEMKEEKYQAALAKMSKEPYIPEYIPMKKGSNEWYLYHSKANEGLAAPLIPCSCFIFLFKGGLVVIAIMWLAYFLVCYLNNAELNNDPLVLKKREEYKEDRKIFDIRDPKYQTEEWKEYYKNHPEKMPGTPEHDAWVELINKKHEEDRYKSL